MELNKYKDLVIEVLNKINREYNISSVDMLRYFDELELIQEVHTGVLTGGEKMEIEKLNEEETENLMTEVNENGFAVVQDDKVVKNTTLVFVNAEMEKVTMENTDKKIYLEE